LQLFFMEEYMGFIDSYKHLEKLCGEVLNDDRPISAYIDEMLNIPFGSCYVKTWNEDLKTLKHYRWIRNKISHEPGCTEHNMCKPEDELWINDFYSRIMNQTDPLTLYHKAITTNTTKQTKITNTINTYTHDTTIQDSSKNTSAYEQSHIDFDDVWSCLSWILVGCICIAVISLILFFIFSALL